MGVLGPPLPFIHLTGSFIQCWVLGSGKSWILLQPAWYFSWGHDSVGKIQGNRESWAEADPISEWNNEPRSHSTWKQGKAAPWKGFSVKPGRCWLCIPHVPCSSAVSSQTHFPTRTAGAASTTPLETVSPCRWPRDRSLASVLQLVSFPKFTQLFSKEKNAC